jgi:5-methylcytosine-specific restriction endonuclease McrA
MYKQYIFQNYAYIIIKGTFTPEQEKLLVQDDFDSERRKFERLRNKHSLAQHTEPRTNRTGIPEEVRIAVWRRDSGRCVRCDSRERLEYDHIIPVSRGGSNTVRNIELLCETCNRNKGVNIQ